MKWIVLVGLLAVGCGEDSAAGVAVLDGAAGASGQGGAAGDATGGSSGSTGTAGAGGAPMPSCYIPLDQISGTDTMAVLSQSNGDPKCANQTRTVQIINGMYYDATWMRTNYVISPASGNPGFCTVNLSYEKMTSTSCGVPAGTLRLRVTLTVPAI